MLSDEDRQAVETAVREAELRTSGEVFCVIAEESSDYGETPLAWAAGAALLGPALLLLAGVQVSVPDVFGGWTAAQVGDMAARAARESLIAALILQGLLFVVTALLVSIRPVRRALTPGGLKRERVRQRASEQFLAKNLHLTRGRTGVLIYVSWSERMAELIADEGVASKVDAKAWDAAMAALVDGLRRGQPGEGFARAIGLCADILAEHVPADMADNPNELPDALVELPRV
jgi:putative membrane protein